MTATITNTSTTSTSRRTRFAATVVVAGIALFGFGASAFASSEPTAAPVVEVAPVAEAPTIEAGLGSVTETPSSTEVVVLIGDPVFPDGRSGVSHASTQANTAVITASPAADAGSQLPLTGVSHLMIEAMVGAALVGAGMAARRASLVAR